MDKEELKYNITGLKVLTEDDVENMLVGALEGGSNYWYMFQERASQLIKEATPDIQDQPFVIRLLTAVQRGASPIMVHDIENNELLGVLTKESWAKAEDLMIKHHRQLLGDIISGNDDASTADVFFQLALMGEIVYG